MVEMMVATFVLYNDSYIPNVLEFTSCYFEVTSHTFIM